jgi:hypothetical protein
MTIEFVMPDGSSTHASNWPAVPRVGDTALGYAVAAVEWSQDGDVVARVRLVGGSKLVMTAEAELTKGE